MTPFQMVTLGLTVFVSVFGVTLLGMAVVSLVGEWS
jgi:hypothetical protein